MSATPRRTPEWLLERIALGELPPARLAEARAQLLAEPDGAARLAALERSNQEILQAHPPATVAAAVQLRAAQAPVPARDWLRGLFTVGLPVAAAAAVVVAVGLQALAPAPGDLRLATPAEDTRLKGLRPHLVLHRQCGTAVEPLADGAAAQAGDLVQLQVAAATGLHAVVLSIDGAGQVTRHLPEAGEQALAVGEVAALSLPSAYELDAAPGYERFVLVTSAQPFAVDAVLRAAEALARDPAAAASATLALEPGLQQSSVLLRKVRE